MSAGADLAGLRRDMLLGIVQRSQRADRRIEEGVEIGFRQIKRGGEDPHDAQRKVLESRIIGLPGFDEALGLGRPDRLGVAEGQGLRVLDAGTRGGPPLKLSFKSGGVSTLRDFASASNSGPRYP